MQTRLNWNQLFKVRERFRDAWIEFVGGLDQNGELNADFYGNLFVCGRVDRIRFEERSVIVVLRWMYLSDAPVARNGDDIGFLAVKDTHKPLTGEIEIAKGDYRIFYWDDGTVTIEQEDPTGATFEFFDGIPLKSFELP